MAKKLLKRFGGKEGELLRFDDARSAKYGQWLFFSDEKVLNGYIFHISGRKIL
jgi:hypothetical protein